ncbi:MAG: tetratricopeptide repeat protein, partial [Blastocatellia bacterium]|nr:tetratricopeptide repeat protein [Blastocatellia bacterium]
SLNNLAELYHTKGDYAKAEPLYERALAIEEKALGPDHPSVATSLNNLSSLYESKGDYAKAEPLYQRVLAIREKALGPEHPDVARSLNNIAGLYDTKGDYAKAEPLYKRALAIREKALGPEHPDVARSLNNIAGLYRTKGDYAKAEPLYERALAIVEKALGQNHPDVAISLDNLASLYEAKGDFAKAKPLYQRALVILEKVLGPNHPDVAISLDNLAGLYDTMGDYAQAEPLHQRALAILEKALGPEHPDVAQSLNNLALFYKAKGDYTKAEPLCQRALAILEKLLGSEHPSVAASLNNIAGLYESKGDYAKAEPLYKRALAILEKTLGQNHTYVAASLNNIAELYRAVGDYTKAEPLHQRALAILEKALGSNHPNVATSLNNLALFYKAKGDYTKAEPLYERSRAIIEKALGSNHPSVAASLNNLATLYEAMGDTARAVNFSVRAAGVSEHNIALNIAAGSERQKLLYLATLSGETDWAVSLHIRSAPSDPTARRHAFTTILRRKGRVLDAMAGSIAALRRRLNPQDRQLLDQFLATRSQHAALVLAGPGKTSLSQYRLQITSLQELEEKLESDISRRSAEFRTQTQPVMLESVQAAIPQGAALVEFVLFYPFNAKENKWGAPRFAAYVLGNRGEPSGIDLGEAGAINKAVEELRAMLRREEDKPLSDIEREVKPRARALDEMVMQPVRRLLGQTRRVFLSPDGALNLIPFAALVDEQGRYLVEQYSFTYLTSGRDLLRLQAGSENKQTAVIVADPDFGEQAKAASGRDLKIKEGAATSQVVSTSAVDFSKAFFPPLPYTAEEAKELKAILPDATVFTREQATEAAVKQVAHPNILHVATHGYFLEDVVTGPPPTFGRGLMIVGSTKELVHDQAATISAAGMRIENPLLRAGLALAGANLRKSGDDDGVLTASEVAALDLWGTKLVVLSACDTGVGEVKNGEGVYGLRRALVLAGSESQVMSLWKVSDRGTRDLMIDYYKGLQAGQGRTDALRQVQLEMLASENRKHPYYWASFIQSGEWANLDGKR